jgi:hypothetical protein
MEFLKFFSDEACYSDYENIIFSIGTSELPTTHLEQTVYPIIKDKCSMDKSLIIAIDKLYFRGEDIPQTVGFGYNQRVYELNKIEINNCNGKYFYKYDNKNNDEKLLIGFFKENIPSTRYGGIVKNDFTYTFDIELTSNDENDKKWKLFKSVIVKLLNADKKVFINNWAFTNSTIFERINQDRVVRRDVNIGHYYEFFPELGKILKDIVSENQQKIQNLFITVVNVIKPIYQEFVQPIQQSQQYLQPQQENNEENPMNSQQGGRRKQKKNRIM